MSFDIALRATEVLLALAFLQQSAEHLVDRADRPLFGLRMLACLPLLFGVAVLPGLLCLVALNLLQLQRFQGPYNGGSDRMSSLILWCLTAAHLAPSPFWAELAMGYLAVQLTLSYFISGQVKLTNPDWRSGRALADVFAFSAYPVAENLRALALREGLLRGASWAVILFEVLFPLALLTQVSLLAALALGAAFHAANACFFGLNRFLWIWLAAYPSLIWLQTRIVAAL
ncbi:hypothetical protein AIOL_000741 [Candidatus Rhodobacter oscarellae]|uniref:HTTM-like domain-containing protein n=1 Tax=Candidatus Rhodobacter oscarellae TaxID=1675527 RepID=A0A0J9EFV7_9RHOB|nr:HTTM domain-containing protein [Candidatus Rhodobacter lobularis]KMW60579.1 hypothetical protein AIOL_000741 [Candidatus Rhodobacter lobularis]